MNALIPTNTNEVVTMAQNLAKSGFFKDSRDASQAFAKVLAGAELGIPAFQSMSGIHIVQGKPQIGSGLIASLIKRSGKYDYKVVELTAEVCRIDFYEGAEKIGTSEKTMKECKAANLHQSWDNDKKTYVDKPTWKNFPKNMLFSRAISDGAKWYTPDVFGGPVYAEGELDDIDREPVQETTATVVAEPAPPRKTKRELAEVMQEQEEVAERKKKWLDSIEGITDIQGIEEAKEEMKISNMDGIGKEVGEALIFRAWQLGWEFDKETKAFVRIPVQQELQPAEQD